MKKQLIIFIFSFYTLSANGQDWFDDTRSDGVNIFKKTEESKSTTLFSTRFNTKEGIILNFFDWSKNNRIGLFDSTVNKMVWIYPSEQEDYKKKWGDAKFTKGATNSRKFSGWGISVKSKADQGLGTLFSSGQLADGFAGNVYYAGEQVVSEEEWEKKYKKANHSESFRFWVFTAGYSNSQFRFYRPTEVPKKQLSAFESTSGFQAGFSYFTISENANSDNVIRGFNVGYRSRNNYKSLAKVEIKDVRNIQTGKDSIKSVQVIDNNGYLYAIEDAKRKLEYFDEYSIKGQFGIIPSKLNYRICFISYPEVVYAKDKASVNIGFGIQFLKDKQPLLSDAGISVKFSDIFNSADKDEAFFKKTFELGLTASLNILTGKIK